MSKKLCNDEKNMHCTVHTFNNVAQYNTFTLLLLFWGGSDNFSFSKLRFCNSSYNFIVYHDCTFSNELNEYGLYNCQWFTFYFEFIEFRNREKISLCKKMAKHLRKKSINDVKIHSCKDLGINKCCIRFY